MSDLDKTADYAGAIRRTLDRDVRAEAVLSEIRALPDEWLAGDYSGDGKVHFKTLAQGAAQLRAILEKHGLQ